MATDDKKNFRELLDDLSDAEFKLGIDAGNTEKTNVHRREAMLAEARILDIHSQLVTTLEAVRRWNLKSSDGGAGGHVMPADLVAMVNDAIEVAS